MTFQRHQDLLNFQNSPFFSLLTGGSEAPAGEAVLHLSLNFETNGLRASHPTEEWRERKDMIAWGVGGEVTQRGKSQMPI